MGRLVWARQHREPVCEETTFSPSTSLRCEAPKTSDEPPLDVVRDVNAAVD
jgi:hypothetical protein